MRKSIDTVNHKANGKRSEADKPDPADDDVLELVHAVTHAYRSLQYRFLRDGPHAITPMDGKVLGYFARHPGATQSELAEHSGRDKAQLARLIKGLRERGLLHAEVDAADRRHVRLSPTRDGQAVQRALQQQALKVAAQAVTGLTAPQRRELLAALRQLLANLAPLE